MSPFPPEDLRPISAQDIVSEGLDDWGHEAGQLRARFATRTFTRGVAFIDRIGVAADAADHHPDVDLRFGHVVIAMLSHDVGAITARDIRLARTISEIAAELGNSADFGAGEGRD